MLIASQYTLYADYWIGYFEHLYLFLYAYVPSYLASILPIDPDDRHEVRFVSSAQCACSAARFNVPFMEGLIRLFPFKEQ